MKKLFALALALIMVMSLALPVMAEEHSNHTITINETVYGHTYEAYRIFAGEVVTMDHDNDPATANVTVLSKITWGDGVDTTKTVAWEKDDGTTVQLTLMQALKSSVANPNSYGIYAGIPDSYTVSETDDYKDDADIAAAVVKALSENNTTANGQAFAKVVGKYLNTVAGTSKPYAQTGTDATTGAPIYTEVTNSTTAITNYQIGGLSDGYYLVKEAETTNIEGHSATEYMLQLIQDVTLNPKDGDITVEKKIKEGGEYKNYADNNIGDVIEFHITANLPDNYAEFDEYYLEFADTLSAGLTLDASTIALYTVNGDDTKLIPSSFYTVYTDIAKAVEDGALAAYNKPGKTPNFVVVFEDLKELTKDNQYTVLNSTDIRLEYKATLNANAEIGNDGNPNEIFLRYDRDPYDDGIGETEEKEVHVFTFQLDVTKINGQTMANLEGVEFVLARQRSGQYQYAVINNGLLSWSNWIDEAAVESYVKNHAEYGQLDEAGQAAKVTELVEEVGIATTLTTDAQGKFSVKGLDQDTYWLIETKALDGYHMIDPVKFTIDATYTDLKDKVKTLTITLEGKQPADGDLDTGIVATTVVNNPGNELPTTGGVGTTMFYVIGGIMVVAALVLLITKKRMVA